MKKVWQRIDDSKHGDCFKCSVCTLFGLEYDDVPNFVEYDNWWEVTVEFFKKHGYKFGEPALLNPNIPSLENPTACCFQKEVVEYDCTFRAIKKEYGVNGLFLAAVYSPKYTNPNEHPINHLHSVLCDINFNVVFDPQRKYKNIVSYPYSSLIGYNGIREIDAVVKI